jgi:hypothetical protein
MHAMASARPFHNAALIWRQQQNIEFQPLPTPFSETRLRQLIALALPPPSSHVALQIRTVHRPRDKKCERIIYCHGTPKISRDALASGFEFNPPANANHHTQRTGG